MSLQTLKTSALSATLPFHSSHSLPYTPITHATSLSLSLIFVLFKIFLNYFLLFLKRKKIWLFYLSIFNFVHAYVNNSFGLWNEVRPSALTDGGVCEKPSETYLPPLSRTPKLYKGFLIYQSVKAWPYIHTIKPSYNNVITKLNTRNMLIT